VFEVVGDIWGFAGQGVIAITTNGSLSRDGRAVLGRGVANQAVRICPELAVKLGRLIAEHGNHVCNLGCGLVSLPVEETAWSLPDLHLIVRSVRELVALTDAAGWSQVVVPRPGCGGGGLIWRDVKPLLEPLLDERFLVISCQP
jgi:hypothetical protein